MASAESRHSALDDSASDAAPAAPQIRRPAWRGVLHLQTQQQMSTPRKALACVHTIRLPLRTISAGSSQNAPFKSVHIAGKTTSQSCMLLSNHRSLDRLRPTTPLPLKEREPTGDWTEMCAAAASHRLAGNRCQLCRGGRQSGVLGPQAHWTGSSLKRLRRGCGTCDSWPLASYDESDERMPASQHARRK